MRRQIAESLIELVQGDITAEQTDAIVNAANAQLAGGGGVDGAIHRAGGPAIMEETRSKYPDGCPTGEAVISGSGNLPCRYVIHTVGPVWQGGRSGEPEKLRAAYTNSLKLAVEHGCQSISFPAISTGVYGYPMDRAAIDAIEAVITYLQQRPTTLLVRFVLFGEGSYGAFARVLEELLPSA